MLVLWKKNKILFVCIIVLLFTFPSAIAKESLAYSHLICVALGIDKVQDEWEVSLQIIVPKQTSTFNESLKVVSGKGENIMQAVDAIKYHTGKDIGFAQCEYVVLNTDALSENVLLPLDFFVKTYNLNYNCILVATDKKANKILQLNGNLGQSYSFDLGRILEYNEENLFSKDTNVETAYNSFLSPNKAFAITMITASDNPSDGIEGVDAPSSEGGGSSSGGSSGGESSSGGSSSGGEDKENVLSNSKKVALLKAGKLVGVINDDEVNGIEYVNPYSKSLQIVVKNYSDKLYNNANISLDVYGKKCHNKYSIIGSKLNIFCETTLHLKITNIQQHKDYEKFTKKEKNYFTTQLIEQIKRQETQRVYASVEKLKEMNLDLIDAYENFDRWCHKGFTNYIKNLSDKNDYFKNVDVQIKFNIIPI